MKIEVIRTYYNALYTKGIMFVDGKFFGYTLEPQRKGNNETSYLNRCIDIGFYVAEYEYSPKFKQNLIELKNVPNHSEIKIHSGNFRKDTRGCILVGKRSESGAVFESKIAVDMLNSMAKNVQNNRYKIMVIVKDYSCMDYRITDELLRESRK